MMMLVVVVVLLLRSLHLMMIMTTRMLMVTSCLGAYLNDLPHPEPHDSLVAHEFAHQHLLVTFIPRVAEFFLRGSRLSKVLSSRRVQLYSSTISHSSMLSGSTTSKTSQLGTWEALSSGSASRSCAAALEYCPWVCRSCHAQQGGREEGGGQEAKRSRGHRQIMAAKHGSRA